MLGLNKLFSLSKLAAVLMVFASIGSIGTYLNFNDNSWEALGVNPKELKSNLYSFPDKHCNPETKEICEEIVKKVGWFIGL